MILGAGANTPKVDAMDFADTRTHWHTGRKGLKGRPGDDIMFALTNAHRLKDALRLWLDHHPEEMERTRAERPEGPLAVSHRTGKTRDRPGTERRFDAVWVSQHFGVDRVLYPYELSIAARSDHSAVIADLSWPTNEE